MRQYTDPVHTFTVPFDARQIRTAVVAYQQAGQRVLTKVVDEPRLTEDGAIRVQLTQEDTALFKPGMTLVQLRVISFGGSSAVSVPVSFYVGETFDQEVRA